MKETTKLDSSRWKSGFKTEVRDTTQQGSFSTQTMKTLVMDAYLQTAVCLFLPVKRSFLLPAVTKVLIQTHEQVTQATRPVYVSFRPTGTGCCR